MSQQPAETALLEPPDSHDHELVGSVFIGEAVLAW